MSCFQAKSLVFFISDRKTKMHGLTVNWINILSSAKYDWLAVTSKVSRKSEHVVIGSSSGDVLKPGTPKRNHRNETTGTKPPEPPRPPKRNHRNHRNSYKNLNKTIEAASMIPPLLNSGRIVMNKNFSNSFLCCLGLCTVYKVVFRSNASNFQESFLVSLRLLRSFCSSFYSCFGGFVSVFRVLVYAQVVRYFRVPIKQCPDVYYQRIYDHFSMTLVLFLTIWI